MGLLWFVAVFFSWSWGVAQRITSKRPKQYGRTIHNQLCDYDHLLWLIKHEYSLQVSLWDIQWWEKPIIVGIVCVPGHEILFKHVEMDLNLHSFIPSTLILCKTFAMNKGRAGNKEQECYAKLSYLSAKQVYLRSIYPTVDGKNPVYSFGYLSGSEKFKQRRNMVTSNDVNMRLMLIIRVE